MRKIAIWFRAHPVVTAFLVLVGVAVGLHFFANWRAEVRWERYCTEARARGVKMTLAEIIGPEIPDAENFATLPMIRAATAPGGRSPFKLPRAKGTEQPYYVYSKGERIDFHAWAKFFRGAGYISAVTDAPARDVLQALEHYAPQFKEWGEWRTRPHYRPPIQLDLTGMMRLPDSSIFMDAQRLLALRMRAHLAAGDSPAALTDFEDLLQTHRVYETPPTLVNACLGIGMLATMYSEIGETLAQPGWSDAELRQLEKNLSSVNLLNNFQQAFSTERVMENLLYDRWVRIPAERKAVRLMVMTSFTPSFTPTWQDSACVLIPSRVFRDNQLRQNQYFDQLLSRISTDGRRFDPDRPTPSEPDRLNGFLDDYYFGLFKFFASTPTSLAEQYIAMQTRLDQTRLAIALERFRLAHGGFPETLAELAPEFIAEVPRDVYSGKPMLYRRVEGGTFILYGVGKNRIDDGGVLNAKGSDGERQDMVWQYAPPAH